ncbi:hypothetical protein [Xanthomonas citri]|uniref:hypothetical protein n=1 Tax=Xanthomonas citri TaxID=346 RepID=UPI0012F9C174|nr:hypothetical protein [Xanthomonas citri]MBE0313902.1 hypothetical protein [Xanthomonas citri pv. punicae]MDS0762276.1 hypothetical protein [Xanthomonas citri pv. punicae]MDS0766099.1 hypothetical protein [Xanthomonas citri pv. punicae]MDS0800861.1 hypothetical protein [Xanthomonas citri pv. punicae]MDS0833492.1 hypothetical protein [Xanthomonas citri pv. punicae]
MPQRLLLRRAAGVVERGLAVARTRPCPRIRTELRAESGHNTAIAQTAHVALQPVGASCGQRNDAGLIRQHILSGRDASPPLPQIDRDRATRYSVQIGVRSVLRRHAVSIDLHRGQHANVRSDRIAGHRRACIAHACHCQPTAALRRKGRTVMQVGLSTSCGFQQCHSYRSRCWIPLRAGGMRGLIAVRAPIAGPSHAHRMPTPAGRNCSNCRVDAAISVINFDHDLPSAADPASTQQQNPFTDNPRKSPDGMHICNDLGNATNTCAHRRRQAAAALKSAAMRRQKR